MRGMLGVLLFVALTAFCWGVYGPTVQVGQQAMAAGTGIPVRLRPFICVGMAYFLIAVIVPIVMLKLKGETGNWTFSGTVWSLLAGAAGALGALGIILAFSFKGNPLYVMPLVFGLAPVVNTFTTMFMNRTIKEISSMFMAGLIIVALGAATVLFAKPSGAHPNSKVTVDDKSGTIKVEMDIAGGKPEDTVTVDNEENLKSTSEKAYAIYLNYKRGRMTTTDFVLVTLFIAMTAFSWGVYGPVLHKGQGKMNGSRLRPFICVGLAYFLIAVLVPLILLGTGMEPTGSFNFSGTVWSLLGGTAGAIGALGLIMAFNAGGKPIFVMPLVFGGAPVINSFVEIVSHSLFGQISPVFYAGLLLVILGAVIVLIFAPKPAPKAAH